MSALQLDHQEPAKLKPNPYANACQLQRMLIQEAEKEGRSVQTLISIARAWSELETHKRAFRGLKVVRRGEREAALRAGVGLSKGARAALAECAEPLTAAAPEDEPIVRSPLDAKPEEEDAPPAE